MSVMEILQVNLITKDDFVSPKPFAYNPNVVKFFTTKTFLDNKILTGNNIEIRPSLFLNQVIFEKAIKLLKDADYSNHTSDEIVKNNIDVFRKALFSQKEQLPLGSKKYYIIKSNYVPNSFQLVKPLQNAKPVVGATAIKNVTQYTITFELSLLDVQRDLKEADFSRANCKLTARELNTQAKELFGVSLGLDGEFPPMKNTAVKSNIYTPGSIQSSPTYSNKQNEELLKTRREIREWLRDYEKNKESKKKEKNINEWQIYKQGRLNEGLSVMGMNEWINNKVQEDLENKYKLEWLVNKNKQDSSGKPLVYDKWLKDKLEEVLENNVETYMNEWFSYKNDQALLGKLPNLNEWLKERVKKNSIHKGGRHKRILNKRTSNKRILNKRTSNKRRSNKRRSNKRRSNKRKSNKL